MPDHRPPWSSAQGPSSSSNPASECTHTRTGKVRSDFQQYYGALPSYITIIPQDGGGPLNDEAGNLTSIEDPLTIRGYMLVDTTEENRQQAIAKGEDGGDGTDMKQFLLKMDDKVRLLYSGNRLTAVTKIND
ncbi:MAG: hypothetical protein Q9175_008155 [Cornicularia normoerica]